MKIAAILGTSSEAIKLAPIIRELRSDREFECHVCVTDQRQQEVDRLLEAFEIVPDSSLDLTAPGLSLSGLTSVAIAMFDAFLRRETPHMVMVEGASTISLAAALAAFYRNIPVLHLETDVQAAEVRSQWPEEANRVLIRRLAELHFAATAVNQRDSLAEPVSPESVIVAGSTFVDALYYAVERLRRRPLEVPGLPPQVMSRDARTPLVLIAGRGHQSFDCKLESLCREIAEIAQLFPQAHFVYSIRLGENVRTSAQRSFAGRDNVHLMQHVPYFEFVALMESARVILTDSRDVQKEARALGKPVVAFFEDSHPQNTQTETTLSFPDSRKDRIVSETSLLLSDDSYLASQSKVILSCGDGHAAARIVRAIKTRYGRSPSRAMCAEGATIS